MKKKEKHPGGRPTKLTQKLIKEICGYIENGNTYARSCILCNINKSTLTYWKKQGREAREKGIENEFSIFLAQIEQAEEKYIGALNQTVTNQALVDGKLALDVLSRKRPKEYGKKDYIRMNANIKSKIRITEYEKKLDNMTADELRKELEKVEKIENESKND